MLYQIHHQPQNFLEYGRTEMCFQFEPKRLEDIENAIAEAWEKFPPPDGYKLMICDENSELFRKAADNKALLPRVGGQIADSTTKTG
jgi:hypothetical protein